MIGDIYQAFKLHRKPLLILASTWGVYFIILFSRLLEWAPEGLYGGHTNIWSDWSAHIGMINIFAYKAPQDWLAYHPYYSVGKFTYPFMTNMVSGFLVRLGVPLISSMVIPSIIYCFLFLSGLYFLFYTLFKSSRSALLTLYLFLFSSGAGFLIYLKDLVHDFKWSSLIYPPADYSIVASQGWLAGNVIEALIAPQRAFLLGLAIASWATYGFLRGLEISETTSDVQSAVRLVHKYWLFSSVLIGLLPFTHPHTFMAISPGIGIIVIYQLIRNPASWRHYLYLVFPAGSLGLFYYLLILRGGIQTSHFQHWSPGWTSEGGFFMWLLMWFKIWGLAIPLAIWGFVKYLRKNYSMSSKLFIGSFFLLFGISNLIFFQPISWDNSKIFFWCYLMFCGLIANELWGFFDNGRGAVKVLGVVLLISLTGTGFLEVYRMQWISKNRALMTETDDIELGKLIRDKTGPRDIFLTAPLHNHFITMWAARSILLGYPGWVWNYGFIYDQTERDVQTMYQGKEGTQYLLAKHNIKYVVIGPEEIRALHANEVYFSSQYRCAFSNKNNRVYDVQARL